MPPHEVFPLEPIAVFEGPEKMTSDTGSALWVWAHRQLAQHTFYKLKILSPDAFQEVAWQQVHEALNDVPCLFQLWTCKQVMGVAGTNKYQAKYTDGHDPHCPSCARVIETCTHVLFCQEEGRVEVLRHSIGWLDDWLCQVGTEPGLRRALI